MPVQKKRLRAPGRGTCRVVHAVSAQRRAGASRKLGPSCSLIAPAHSLTLPSIQTAKERFEVSTHFEAALPLARCLVTAGLLRPEHMGGAASVVEVLGRALSELVAKAWPANAEDNFGVEVELTDRLDDDPRAS